MKKAINIFLLLFLSLLAVAQNSNQQEIHFNHLFVKDGMPEGRANFIVQDNQGYMWIGTQKGLVRYDGYSAKVYDFGIENPYYQSIGALYTDKEGRLWVSVSASGLYLYDRGGDRFIPYKPNSSASDIFDIHEDHSGHLWLIYYDYIKQKGLLARFDLSTKKFIKYDNEEKGAHHINASAVTNFFEDEKGSIWIGSDNGIYHYNEKTDHLDPYLAIADSAKQNTFYLSPFQKDIVWISVFESKPQGKAQGLWRYDTRTNAVTVFRHRIGDSSSIASDNIQSVRTDSVGRFWVATDNGLSLFDPVKNNFINYRLKNNNTGKFISINEIQQDKNENLWLATGEGLVFFNTQTRLFAPYTAREKDPHGIADNHVHNLFIDHSGTLWFGSAQIGLQWINKQLSRFIQYKDEPGQPHNFPGGVAFCFAEAKDSTIWLGSAHGLYHWQPRTDSFTFVKIKKNQEKDFYVEAVMVDKEGLIWCGVPGRLSPAGLYCYDPKTGKTKYFSNNKKDTNSLSANSVTRLLEDHLGNIWVGTYGGGICRFNEQSQNFTRYPYVKGFTTTNSHGALDDIDVISMYEDKNGTLWAGTNWGGLNKFNRQTGTFTSYKGLLPGFQCVSSISSDDKNGLWAGTYFGGVFSFDPQSNLAKKYTQKDGLLYDGAQGIVEDGHDNLWLASYRGLSIFNLQTKQVRKLTSANGLPSENLINAFKTSSGRFLFGSNDGGFISVNPNDFTPDPQPPIVHIESVDFVTTGAGKTKDSSLIIFGKDSVSLKYNENRLSFHYVGLYYQNSQLNQYAYNLDGYDKDWIAAGTQRSVTYTNLSPGNYSFHVKASNSDGVWNEQGDSFSFTILPPWWQTWWAYALYILIFVLAVLAFAAYRSRNLRRANQVLEEKVEHRTSQLNKSIEDLRSTQSQLIQSEKMASLGELTAGIAHEIQNPLNFVNNFAEVNKELSDELVQEAEKGNIDEVKIIAKDIKENSEKINHHGKRADAIVKGMLQHSRSSIGVKEPTDINALADEYLRLSYHGLRAKDNSFNATMKTDFDSTIGKINIIPQDIGRVLLNLYNNAFYAVSEKAKLLAKSYQPTTKVSTRKLNDKIEIRVEDNGNGIPQKVLDKIFQPFFTTKPAGQGTGLGLSLSYDIVKAHGGEIKVETKEGEGTEFIIQLPV
jgi:ligand-binding sensor domain-containing protein